jgi:phosphoenolpyruvate-protein kinase (PTS system EI component)
VGAVKDGDAEASDVLANAGSVPSEHPMDDWPEAKAETAISRIKQAAADREDMAAEEAQAENDKRRYEDATEALQAHFDAAWSDGKEDWEAISEAQLNRLYAIADDEGWDEAALNRLVKDELGWESKADIPYGDPYEEICDALEDERLRYHMSRDPDTPDMFEEDGGVSQDLDKMKERVEEHEEANDPAFEDGAEDDDLPF